MAAPKCRFLRVDQATPRYSRVECRRANPDRGICIKPRACFWLTPSRRDSPRRVSVTPAVTEDSRPTREADIPPKGPCFPRA